MSAEVAPAESSADQGDGQSIRQVVAESLRENSKEAPIKRPRGRPRKDQSQPKAEQEPPLEAAPLTPPAPPVEIPLEILKPALGFPFQIAALKTGFDGFNLEDAEAEALAGPVNAVIQRYFPASAAESPHAALYMLAGSVALLAGTKYMAFLQWQAAEKKKAQDAAGAKEEKTNPSGAAFPTVSFGGVSNG